MTDRPPLLFLVAGEPSGDILGGRLMAALRRRTDDRIAFAGVGGPRMMEHGLEPLFPMGELSVMGVAEIATKIPNLLRLIGRTAAEVGRLRPAALITIDAPDFSFRVARRVQPFGVPRIHYVAPSVWAWRPGRAAKISRFLDHLLALLPFEPPYFEAEGLPCSFVGHPAIEGGAGQGDGPAFRARHNISPDREIVIMLPGSRHGELDRLLPIFLAALGRLKDEGRDLAVVAPITPHLADRVRSQTAQAGFDAVIVEGDPEKFDAFAAAKAALAKSGTVTLELALAGVPSVIGYRINPLTHAIVSRMTTGRFAGLPNVVLDRPLMPELLQYACTPERAAHELRLLLDDPLARQAQIAGTDEIRRRLSLPGTTPSAAAAEVIMRVADAFGQRAPIGA